MKAPEKIYMPIELLSEEWTRHVEGQDIEYIRKDMFVEKANKWLSLNMKMLMNVLDVEYDTHDTDVKDFIADFKKYMEEQQ